jgi:hypothetical protein
MVQRIAPAVALVIACGSPTRPEALAIGQPPSEQFAPSIVRADDAWEIELDPALGTARRMRGAGVAFDAADRSDAELARAAIAFVRDHAELFGAAELSYAGAVVDPELTSIMLTQHHRGVPVIGGHLGLTVSRGKLVLAQGAVYRLDGVAAEPRVTHTRALAAVRDALAAPHTGDRDTARLVVVPPHLVWEVTAWRGPAQTIAYVDAERGDVLSAYDANRYDFPGKATQQVDERTVGDAVVTLPASYLRLHSQRGSAMTDAGGAFAFRGQVGALIVTANLAGAYVAVRNVSGDSAKFVGMMRHERAYSLEWTEAHATPEERDVFRAATETNRFVATVFPDLAWIGRPVPANVNHPYTCNAYWNGTSINFFEAGRGCNNTGRIYDVVAHEWGHGLDDAIPGGAIDGALGEFIGDLISFVQTGSPLLGPGFFVDGRPVRDLQDPRFTCFDPDKREVHDAGHLLGTVVWDIRTDLIAAGVTGEALKRLLLRPIAIGRARSQWYSAMLAVDDDDGNLANGTPHECLIYRQFEQHSCKGTRWPGMPPRAPEHCVR